MPSIVLHLMNEDPILGEVEVVPATGDTSILIKNRAGEMGKMSLTWMAI